MLKTVILLTLTILNFITYEPAPTNEKEEVIEYNIPILDPKDSSRSEEDIYNTENTEFVEQTALKAVRTDYNGFTFYCLTDLQGSTYITSETLEHGKNYIGFVNVDTKELLSYMESSFIFTYEEDWQNDTLLQDEIEYNMNELKINL